MLYVTNLCAHLEYNNAAYESVPSIKNDKICKIYRKAQMKE